MKIRTVLMVLLVLVLCSCRSTWYTEYGFVDKNDMQNPAAGFKLIKALDDPDPNVRKSAINYIALYESSIKQAESKLREMEKSDSHPNVRREAERLLAIIDEKKIVEIEVVGSTCNGFMGTIGSENIHFATRVVSKYYPIDYRPLSSDNVRVAFYQFQNKNVVLSVEAIDLPKKRSSIRKKIVGTIGAFPSWRYEQKVPLILEDNSQIIINLGTNPETLISYRDAGGDPREKVIKKGDKVKVFIKDRTVGAGSCYVYSVEKIEFADGRF